MKPHHRLEKCTTVINDDERAWTVRLVETGDHYGLRDCLTNLGTKPMVEFYDRTYTQGRFGPRGQFVSSYYLKTLKEGTTATTGLCLHGGVDVWHVSADNVRFAIDFAEKTRRPHGYVAQATKTIDDLTHGYIRDHAGRSIPMKWKHVVKNRVALRHDTKHGAPTGS